MAGSTSKALLWKLLERFGVQGAQFVLQIILARILSPEHYGALSIMIIFTNIANVFVQSGFNTALIQKKDVDDRDFSSVFWASLLIAGVLYTAIYLLSPVIAGFYNMPEIIKPFRVIALMLFPGAFNSVQLAKVRREMNFKKVFVSNVAGILIAGGVGIAIAYLGGGLWALVAQTLLNIAVTCLVMLITVRWFPKLVFDIKRVGVLLKFGWKLLVSSLIDVVYQDLRSLVVGKKYDSETLGYYTRGKQFPHFITNAINGTVSAVMLPAMSREQENRARVKEITRKSISLGAFIMCPMMAGLAVCAEPIVTLLLTEKWLPCVPYLQIYCFTMAFLPIHSCNLQAINAVGRSDIFLKLEIIKKAMGLTTLAIAVIFFDTPIAIAATGIVTTLISSFINAHPNKKLIGYSYLEQIKDMLPAVLTSTLMGALVYLVNFLELSCWVSLLIQIPLGVITYALLSLAFCRRSLMSVFSIGKKIFRRD